MPTMKPTLAAVVIRGVLDDLGAIRDLALEGVETRDIAEIASGAAARLERALEEIERQRRAREPLHEACCHCGERLDGDLGECAHGVCHAQCLLDAGCEIA